MALCCTKVLLTSQKSHAMLTLFILLNKKIQNTAKKTGKKINYVFVIRQSPKTYPAATEKDDKL